MLVIESNSTGSEGSAPEAPKGKGQHQNIDREFSFQKRHLMSLYAKDAGLEEKLGKIYEGLASLNGLASGSGKLPRFVIAAMRQDQKLGRRSPLICSACVGVSAKSFAKFSEVAAFTASLEARGERLLTEDEMKMYAFRLDLDETNLILPTGSQEGEDIDAWPLEIFYEYKFERAAAKKVGDEKEKSENKGRIAIPPQGVSYRRQSEHISAFQGFVGCRYHVAFCKKEAIIVK